MLSSNLGQLFSRYKSNIGKDEAIPFAQHDQAGFVCESAAMDDKKLNDEGLKIFAEVNGDQRQKRRRDTVTGIEKPTISSWDAGWNVSNAIQVCSVCHTQYKQNSHINLLAMFSLFFVWLFLM